MNKLYKFATSAAVTSALLLGGSAVALASTNNVLFDPNGSGSTQVDVGSSVQMNAYVDSSSSQELESVFVKFPGANGLAAQGICYTINPAKIGASPAGGWLVSLPVTVPTSAGVWSPSLTFYGINGDGADTTCSGSAVFGTQSFSNRITVTDINSTGTQTGNSGGSNGGNTGGSHPSSTDQKLDALIALMTKYFGAGSPSTKPACPPAGSTSQTQAWLMANGYAAGFSAIGVYSPTGFWGPVTTAAYNQAMNACK